MLVGIAIGFAIGFVVCAIMIATAYSVKIDVMPSSEKKHRSRFPVPVSDEADSSTVKPPPLTSSVRECGCTVSDGWRCPVHG